MQTNRSTVPHRILREYMQGVTGNTFYTVSEYQKECAEADMPLKCFDRIFVTDREISAFETVLGPSEVVRDGTASLWENSLREYLNRDFSGGELK